LSEVVPASNGILRVVTGTDPAAGAEIVETVPAGKIWRLLSIRFALVTDATVASRRTHVIIDDGTSELFRVSGSTDQTASSTARFSLSPAFGTISNNASTNHFPMPSIHLEPGFRIQTSTSNIQAGDNYGAPIMYVEEWTA
jgi:hypothetical protein